MPGDRQPDAVGARLHRPAALRRHRRRPIRGHEPRVKSPEIIERMRVAGAVAAEVLRLAGEMVAPGRHHRRDRRLRPPAVHRARRLPEPAQLQPLSRRACCTSVNEVICHGIPDPRALQRRRHRATSTSPATSAACTATPTPRSSSATSTPRAASSCGSPRSACGRASRPSCRAARSATSAGPSRTTPKSTTTAWCGRSSATASASSSTPTCRSCTTTTRAANDRSCARA